MPGAPMLSAEEARVLGCLMEKAATTPDHYPLSLNALVTACNQTTNRDPVVHYDDELVEAALTTLREKGVARRLKAAGARVVKHLHVVDEALGLGAGERAVLGVLLLRGAQTPGELKQRTERWHELPTLEAVEEVLERLARHEPPLVVREERRPGQKEARWAQRLAAPEPAAPEPAAPEPASHPPPGPAAGAERIRSAAVVTRLPGALEVRDPSTGTTVETLVAHDEPAIRAMVAAARDAVAEWSGRPYEVRSHALLAFRDLLFADVDALATTTARETGKPVAQGRNEVRAAAGRVEWFVEHVPGAIADRTVTASPDLVERVTYEPAGVVAHVSAWNYPYFVALNTIAPALLVGNTVVYKPSELASLTGLRIIDLLHRAGVPREVVHVAVGGGAAGALVVDADVDVVCFTGSYATGLRVAAAAAANLTRAQLELGGKDAAYVCDDVDVARVAPAVAEGIFYNAGQSCCAIERLYVHDAIFDPFVEALVAIVRGYRVGDPADTSTDVGPLARAAQPDLLEQQVADAVAKGARVLVGGRRPGRPGSWFEPTVLVDVDHTMRLMREESFGPVIGVHRVRDDEEARALMDDTEYGLTGAVFSDDEARAMRLLTALDTGSVYWNTSDRTSVCLPWAGRRHSGLGVSLSESGVRCLAREKAWHLRPPPR